MREVGTITHIVARKIQFRPNPIGTNRSQTRAFQCQIEVPYACYQKFNRSSFGANAIIRLYEDASHAFSRLVSLKKDRLIAIILYQDWRKNYPFLIFIEYRWEFRCL